jgi:lysophospholipase L1-like esterase
MLRRLLSHAALIALGIVIALVLLEILLRGWYSTRGTEQERIRYVYSRAEIAAQTAQLVGIPYLNYTLNPTLEDVNEYGYRGAAVAIPKPDSVLRIVTLGGSTTYGHALTADEAYPTQLERILRDDYAIPNVEVVNLGVPGYFSLDSLVNLATRGLALQPDLIIVYDGVNDAAVRIFQDPACYNAQSPLLGMGLDRGIWFVGDNLPPSTVYRVLALRFGWMQDPSAYTAQLRHTGYCPPGPQGIDPLDILAQNPPTLFERNLRGIVALARANDADVLLSTFAWDSAAAQALLDNDPSQTGTQALVQAIDQQNALVRQLASDLDIPLVDLITTMGQGAYFQGDYVHQTAEGARRQAQLYAEWIAGVN